jgi:hypothetical protein
MHFRRLFRPRIPLYTAVMRLPQSTSHTFYFSAPTASFAILLALVVSLSWGNKAAAQQLVSSPSSLRFGKVAIGASERQVVILTNTGQARATVSTVGVSNGEFKVSGITVPLTLGAGQSVPFNVNFAPNVTGWTSGQITFTGANLSLQLGIRGTGVTSDPLTASPSALSFGRVALGTKVNLSLVLTNTGSWSQNLTSLGTVGSAFSATGPSFPMVLASGHSVTLTVSYLPEAVGLTGGSVFISGPNINVPLTGTGTNPTAGQLTVAPTAVNFGNVNVGATTTHASSITATGGSVTVSAANDSNSQFSVSGISLPLTISAGQTVAFDVAFSPTQSGASTSTLTFASNASNSGAGESLAGTGVAPQHTVNLSWDASTSSVTGYNVYRGPSVGTYTKINSTTDPNTAYADSTVLSGTTYYYAATAVNSSGQESTYSTAIKVVVP